MNLNPFFAPLGANWPAVRGFIRDLVWPEGAVCCACGKISDGSPLCPACRSALRSDGSMFRWEKEDLGGGLTAWWMTPHTGIARTLVLRLKHRAEACIAKELTALLRPLPKDFSFPEGTVVTWVAMPENRRRDRMIDHGRLLAEAVAEELSLPCRPLLVRRKTHDRNQARLGREARQKNLRAAFLPAAEMDFPVLLVDDVLTTGTTARRCAEALRAGGAPSVTVLAMTRAMGGRPA